MVFFIILKDIMFHIMMVSSKFPSIHTKLPSQGLHLHHNLKPQSCPNSMNFLFLDLLLHLHPHNKAEHNICFISSQKGLYRILDHYIIALALFCLTPIEAVSGFYSNERDWFMMVKIVYDIHDQHKILKNLSGEPYLCDKN